MVVGLLTVAANSSDVSHVTCITSFNPMSSKTILRDDFRDKKTEAKNNGLGQGHIVNKR